MNHPFSELEPIISKQIDGCQIIAAKAARIDAVARHLLSFKERYAAVSQATGVPIAWIAATHERESDADFTTYLGNGDPLSRPSVHVPRGRGPFRDWPSGAVDALILDRINQVNDWMLERAVYEWILYNGFGPLSHGKQSGYAWAGTTVYDGGKYVADGVWDPSAWDSQLGAYPIAARMIQLDASLALPRAQKSDQEPAAPTLVGIGSTHGADHDTKWLQTSLDALGALPVLLVDGSYGRMTRRAVEAFQDREGLTVDGFAGPETIGKIEDLLKAKAA